MNILIPHTWLLDHLETEATPEEIAKHISLCGPSVEHIYTKEGEPVYDIEVTTNRVDSMSIRGIAREASVILNQFGIAATLKPLTASKPATPTTQTLPLPKVTNDPKLCNRTMAIILKNVERKPSPDWMQRRLKQIDVNVHDAVIDITNYITHELGHPCHAFDYDNIMELGGEIIITEAKPGETFAIIDGEEFTTVGGEIVFKNPSGEIIDLPAIKGTANSSINDQTKNVLLWIESLDHKKVRFASMTHAIRTVAAQLNEKRVDPHLGDETLYLGISLFQELAGATIASDLYDDFPSPEHPKPVQVSLSTISEYLGLELPRKTVTTILENLGCSVEATTDTITVTPPTFRPDITIPADVIEEVARVYGYHNLPSTLMDTAIPTNKPETTDFNLETTIKHFLSTIGWQEVYTYSLVSEKLAEQSGHDLENDHLKLSNPLTDDRVYLRQSLLPSLEECIANNSQRKNLSVFEIANIYQPREGQLPLELLMLSMVSSKPYREVKGDLEALFDQFFLGEVIAKPTDYTSPLVVQHATLTIASDTKQRPLASIAVLHTGHTAIDVRMDALLELAKTHPEYQPIPKTAQLQQDLTFTLPQKALVGELIRALRQSDGTVASVDLTEIYNRNHTFRITYFNPKQNISGEDVTPIRKRIISLATKQFAAELVGEVE